MLGSLHDSQKKDWHKYVKPLTHAYNCMVNETTGYSRYLLLFGRHARLPIDVLYGTDSDVTRTKETTQYVRDLKERLEYAYKLMQENTKKAAVKNKGYYEKRAKASTLEKGDRVLVRKLAIKGKQKLADRWEPGVYVVKSKLKDIPVYIVEDEDLISNNNHDGNHISDDKDDRKDQDNDQNNRQDDECVAPSIWMCVDMTLDNDLLVISDSLLKTIDENFIQWRRDEVYPFSRLRTRGLLDILRKQHQRGVRDDTLIICVGTNDYYRTSPTKVSTYLKKVIAVATTMSPDVVLFTVPDSHWKGKFGNLKSNRRNQRKINAAIQDLTSRSVRVFDLDHIFRGQCGMRHENRPGWYHKDSVHFQHQGDHGHRALSTATALWRNHHRTTGP